MFFVIVLTTMFFLLLGTLYFPPFSGPLYKDIYKDAVKIAHTLDTECQDLIRLLKRALMISNSTING